MLPLTAETRKPSFYSSVFHLSTDRYLWRFYADLDKQSGCTYAPKQLQRENLFVVEWEQARNHFNSVECCVENCCESRWRHCSSLEQSINQDQTCNTINTTIWLTRKLANSLQWSPTQSDKLDLFAEFVRKFNALLWISNFKFRNRVTLI